MKKPATKAEKEFMAKVKELPCIVCGYYPVDCHHITEGGRRLGNMYCLPLCFDHHEGQIFSIGNHKKSFIKKYGTELELLEKVYKKLGMVYVPKQSKIVKGG